MSEQSHTNTVSDILNLPNIVSSARTRPVDISADV